MLFFSLSSLFFALFIVESRSFIKKNKITCFLSPSLSISPIGFLGLFPSFPVVCLSVVCCLLSVPFLTLSSYVISDREL